jgi:tetratricopeptide (TPR) repeat protein
MKTGMDAAAGPLVRARHDLARGRPDRALAALENVTGLELESEEFWSLRAAALYDVGDAGAAVLAAQKGLEHDPSDFVLLDVLALSQLAAGHKKDARATIDAALLIYPESATLHAHRALILARSAEKSFRLASYKKARAAVDEALRLDPDCEAALRARAQVAALSGDPRAEVYAADLLAHDPEDEHAHVISGVAHARRGNVHAGLDHYLEAARLDPSDPKLAWLGRKSRILQSPFVAPVLWFERVTHGRVRFAWVFVMIAVRLSHQPVLIAAALLFWVYMWVVHFYVRARAGRSPA